MAVVTFGGAYAVLAYVAQEAVEHYRWLAAGRDAGRARPGGDHAGAADPGAAIRRLSRGGDAGGLASGAARSAALLTLWVTFAPCFAWIFLGAPYVERLHEAARLGGRAGGGDGGGGRRHRQPRGLVRRCACCSARVRAVPLGPMVLEVPVPASLDPVALLLAALAAVCLFRMKLGVVQTLAIAAVAGLAAQTAVGWLLGRGIAGGRAPGRVNLLWKRRAAAWLHRLPATQPLAQAHWKL